MSSNLTQAFGPFAPAIEYMVDTPWGELLVFDPDAREARARDEKVGVTFDRDAAMVLKR